MDELSMIHENLLRCADIIVEAYESKEGEAGFLAFRATESEVAQYIVRLFELGVLTSLLGIDEAVRRYNETDPENLDFTGSGMSARNMNLFDEVIGYRLWARNLEPGLIRFTSRALSSIVSESQRQYSLFAPRQIQNAIRLLASLIPTSKDSTLEDSSADKPLAPNQSTILEAMFILGATVNNVISADVILKKAGIAADSTDAFKSLKKLKLIEAKQGVGRYLTERGIKRAKEIQLER